MNTMIAWGLHELVNWVIILALLQIFYSRKKES